VRLSTQVIDCAFGAPAASVGVLLRRLAEADWHEVAHGSTGADGRLSGWHGRPLRSGTYQLEFDLDGYYSALGTIPLYPRVIVEFRVSDPTVDLHLPLLVTPNSFYVYRGN